MDSDEEEMKAMRNSARYGGGRRPAPGEPEATATATAAADSDDEQESTAARSAARQTRPQRGPAPQANAGTAVEGSRADNGMKEDGDDDSDAMSVEGENPAELGAMRGFLPVTFGRVEKVPQVQNEALQASRRKDATNTRQGAGASGAAPDKKGVVQFGTRIKEAAAVAGASRRAARAEEAAKAAATAAAERAQALPNQLPDGWEMKHSRSSGKVYYVNEKLNKTQWDPPAGFKVDLVLSHGASREEDDNALYGVDAPPLPGQELEVLPVSHESILNPHEKAVTAIGLDPKGARMIAGSMDGWLKFYDFNGMSEAKESFRSCEPVEGHMIQAVSWSTTGGMALVVCSDSHARVYDRDGSSRPIQSTVMGDMYVRDMSHTQGHTQMLTDGVWHPFAAENWITSSIDGTIRIWDINAKPVGMDQVLPSMHVLKTLDKRGVCIGGASGKHGGLYPLCCTLAPTDAQKIVGGCSDGSVQVFFAKARYQKPDRVLRNAHTAPVTGVSFVAQGGDSNLLATRSLDDSMKIWDCRMLSDAKGPVKIFGELPTAHEKTGLCTSPDGKYVVTGTGFQKGSMGAATVRIFDTKEFKQVKSLDFGNRSVIRVTWHEELNQLLVGTHTGEVVMMYNPYSSKKGALHFVGRHKRAKAADQLEDTTMGPIFNMTDGKDIQKFWNTGHGNMQSIRRQLTRQEQKTLVPQRPKDLDGKDSVHTAGTKLVNSIINKMEGKSIVADQDSQKALLAYADKAENDTQFMQAYKNQPKLLDYTVDESEGDKKMQVALSGDFCRKCGQKMCRCVDYSVVRKKQKLL